MNIKDLAGNWKEFLPLKWWNIRDIKDPERYMVVHERECKNRMKSFLNEKVLKGDVLLERYHKWGVGWGNVYCIPVYDKEGNITEIFKKYMFA